MKQPTEFIADPDAVDLQLRAASTEAAIRVLHGKPGAPDEAEFRALLAGKAKR